MHHTGAVRLLSVVSEAVEVMSILDVRTAVGYTNSVEMGRDKPEHTKNVAELILPVNRPHRVAPRSNSVLQSFVNVLNVSAANDLPDDRCGSHLGSIAETRMELGEVNSSKSNVDCARTIQPLREVCGEVVARTAASPTISVSSYASLTGTQECVTPVTVRAHSNSNTPSALNRTCYSRAEFEQKKLTMAVQMFLSGSPRYIVTSESTVGQTKKLGEEAGKQRCVGHNSTMICDEHLTIRGRIPRGQTRRLASLFEDLTTAVANEAVGHPCSLTPGRNKSVPARASPMAYKQQNLDERRSLGGTILGGRCQDGRKFSADESVGRPASSNHNGHERFVERCPSQPFLQSRYAENMTRVRVQSLVNRFEPNRGDGQRCDALMTEEIQTAQPSQSHWQHTLALHERHPAMVEIGSDYSGLSNSPRISNMRRGEICEKRRPQSAAGRRRVSTALRSRLWVNSRGVNEENEHERFYTDAPSGVPNKAAGSGDASRHGLHRFTDWVTAKPDEALRGSIDNTDAHKCELGASALSFTFLQLRWRPSIHIKSDPVNGDGNCGRKRQTKCLLDFIQSSLGNIYSVSTVVTFNLIPGCGDLNVERDHSSGGDGNLAHFTGVHVQEADAACTRTIHKTNILLGSEENAVGVHTAKGFAGLQQPPLDSAQKEPCLDRSSSLSDISTTTIGEMNDRADYVKMAKRLKEAMCMQESHISEIMETLAFYGKNKVRKFAKIYTERELLLCRERYSVLHRELQRVEALLSKYKRIPQLSQSVQSTCEVSSITVQLCRNFRTGSIGEKGSYAFVALLKTGERVDATEAVSLIDCGVGTVRFGSHFHFTALPLDFGIVIEIYAMVGVPYCHQFGDLVIG
ncbi:unnamed protein product [Toxocara canis]|uniref:Anillin domain-containing protein n=1 Tax=Toxocara canis TaxID=6265 RepID=A0A183V4C3_TOXCA|nr:unnamed protein product [Toxocara canis]